MVDFLMRDLFSGRAQPRTRLVCTDMVHNGRGGGPGGCAGLSALMGYTKDKWGVDLKQKNIPPIRTTWNSEKKQTTLRIVHRHIVLINVIRKKSD